MFVVKGVENVIYCVSHRTRLNRLNGVYARWMRTLESDSEMILFAVKSLRCVA